MSKQNLHLAKFGEDLAVMLLRNRGYKIIARNYRTKLGEIDIVAEDKDTICFVEVKTRRSERFGSGKEAVSVYKQKQISKSAILFLKENNLLNQKARFDVVSVMQTQDKPKLDLIKNAFDLSEDLIY